VLVSAGAGLGYLLVTNPRYRRIARGLLRVWLGTGVPAYLLAEIGRAWVESNSFQPAKRQHPAEGVS